MKRTVKTRNLKSFSKMSGGINEFQKFIKNELGENILFFDEEKKLVYSALNRVTPINKKIDIDKIETIRDGAWTMLKYWGFHKFERFSKKEFKNNTTGIIKAYFNEILGFKELPQNNKSILEYSVKQDLTAISKLIKKYEEDGFILKVISENAKPANHEQRIKFDFYKRCINEQKIILDYYLNNIGERAIEKSYYHIHELERIYPMFTFHKDRPYYYAYPNSVGYFDYNKMDTISHRLAEVPVMEGEALKKIYLSNRNNFYQRLKKTIPIESLFQQYDYYLSYVPLKNDRKSIFEEIKKLYKSQRWIGLFALSIAQIEGLFTEMINATADNKKKFSSLTEKVEFIRDLYQLSRAYFDYYQYEIPNIRNQFMHAGYSSDYKLKCYDLLYDLAHLLRVFYELENPYIHAIKVIKRRDTMQFISIEDFNKFFDLIKVIPQNKYAENIKLSYDEFEKDFLNKECELEYTIEQLAVNLPLLITELKNGTNNLLFSFDFEKLKINKQGEIENLTDELKDSVSNFCFMNGEKIKKTYNYCIFIEYSKTYLPSLKNDSQQLLNAVNRQYSKDLYKLKAIYQNFYIYK